MERTNEARIARARQMLALVELDLADADLTETERRRMVEFQRNQRAMLAELEAGGPKEQQATRTEQEQQASLTVSARSAEQAAIRHPQRSTVIVASVIDVARELGVVNAKRGTPRDADGRLVFDEALIAEFKRKAIDRAVANGVEAGMLDFIAQSSAEHAVDEILEDCEREVLY